MSHSLHRYGTKEDLQNDYCIYARCAKGINRDNAGDKLRKILEIYLSEDFVNFGSGHAGNCYVGGLDPKEYEKEMDTAYGMICNFSDRDTVRNVLAKIKSADLGISIVVSGLIDEVRDICKECGLTPHTATLSLGIFGDRSRLPDDDILKITTMCGHSLIGNTLVKTIQEKVRSGKMSPEDAALLLAKPCVCGIFNTRRCAALISKQAQEN